MGSASEPEICPNLPNLEEYMGTITLSLTSAEQTAFQQLFDLALRNNGMGAFSVVSQFVALINQAAQQGAPLRPKPRLWRLLQPLRLPLLRSQIRLRSFRRTRQRNPARIQPRSSPSKPRSTAAEFWERLRARLALANTPLVRTPPISIIRQPRKPTRQPQRQLKPPMHRPLQFLQPAPHLRHLQLSQHRLPLQR